MAIVNKSGSVNKLSSVDSPTLKLSSTATNGGTLHFIRDTVEVAAADDDGSIYRLARVPSNAVLNTVVYENDAITGGTSYSLGFYYTPEKNAGAAIDTNNLVSAADLSSASTGFGSNGMSAVNIDSKHKQVWEIAGLSADPKCLVDIAFTATTVGSAAGTITLSVTYSLV